MINKKKVATIKILSHWQKRISVSNGIASVKHHFYNAYVDSVLEMIRTGCNHNIKMRKKWIQQSIGRNNTAFTYASIFCKAGVEHTKALNFILELIPDFFHCDAVVL